MLLASLHTFRKTPLIFDQGDRETPGDPKRLEIPGVDQLKGALRFAFFNRVASG